MTEKILQFNNKKNIVWALIFTVVVLFAFYGYLIKKTVLNVVERGRAEQALNTLGSKVGELEFQYIALKNKVNLDLAYTLGFKNVEKSAFISRKTPDILSLNFLR